MATLLSLAAVPMLYYVVQSLSEKFAGGKAAPALADVPADLSANPRPEDSRPEEAGNQDEGDRPDTPPSAEKGKRKKSKSEDKDDEK